MCPNPTAPTLRNRTSDSRLTFHPLPTHFPSLSRHTCRPFVVSTLALSNSSRVSFPGVRTKTFSTHVTTKIAPAVRETWLFTHGRASLNFTIIPMCTSDVAVPCHAMPGRDVLCPSSFAPSAPPARELLSCPVSRPSTPTLRHRTSDSLPTFILSPLACHHSPSALSIPLSFPHRPSPILTTFLSMSCVLKRFPLTSPRKLSLTCVKWGFLRTAEPH